MSLSYGHPVESFVSQGESNLRDLLAAWQGGDQEALSAILERHQEWLHRHVRRRLGTHLRGEMESMDMVQEVAVDVMQYGPKFVCSSEDDFRALLGRIVENNLRDRGRRMHAARRDARRKQELMSGMSVDLDAPAVSTPSMKASRRENEEWMRLALEFLEPTDREVVLLRQFDNRTWEEIGELLEIGKSAARMRFERALPRLALKIQKLRKGELGDLLREDAQGG